MKTKQNFIFGIALLFLVLTLGLTSAVIVDADYVTIFHGERGTVSVEIENNENFDIEDASLSLILDDVQFSSVGSSEKDVDDIDEDDSERVSFTLNPFTDIIPGDYDIPYTLKYKNAENSSVGILEKTGSFGIRVSAETDLDFSVEIRGNAIVGEEGRISLDVINKGLGEVKSMSVQIFASGYELLSKDKIFIGSIDADDTDLASFDVIYKNTNPTFSAKVDYKDFDNIEQTKTVNIPFTVYTKERALELGLIQKSNSSRNMGLIVAIIIIWFTWRSFKKRRKNKLGGR